MLHPLCGLDRSGSRPRNESGRSLDRFQPECRTPYSENLQPRPEDRSGNQFAIRSSDSTGTGADLKTKGRAMYKIAAILVAAMVIGFDPAPAQDITGMEDCTKTAGLDKRTGCFQSNVEFLHKLIVKNCLQQKLSAAHAEIG